ncbi:MAG: gamma-glutamyltransferase [Sphingomonas sp.]
MPTTHLRRAITLINIACIATPAVAADLSPAHWPEAERLRLEQREAAIWPTEIRNASSRQGLVTGTASPIAVHAGAEALRQGGTAADAAIATALTQVTTMLGANVSYAGVAQIVYFEARTGRVYTLDAGWGTWRGERSPATIPGTDLSMITGRTTAATGAAGRKALVPGFMAGMAAIHHRFGRLPFPTLFAPSIWYAEHGVPVTPLLGAYFGVAQAGLSQTPEGRAFTLPDGVHPPKVGERFVPPGLAATLKSVAREGAGYMYRGAWARHYVATLGAHGGAASMVDMAVYKPRWTAPLSTSFAGATVYGPDQGNSNGCAILTALNLLDHAGPSARYWQDAASFRTTALALRFAISAPYAGGIKAFEHSAGFDGTCAARLTPAYGAAAAKAFETLTIGSAIPPEGHHSASVVAIDRWGNVAALVHSSNTPLWGDTGMVVDGVPVPAAAGIYQYRLAGITPGDRLPGDMVPLILMRHGKPEIAIASIGTSLVPETVRLMLGLGRGEDGATWLAAPPLLFNFEAMKDAIGEREELVPAGSYPADLLARLRTRDLHIREVDSQRTLFLRGTAVVGALGSHGERQGSEVPGVMGFAEAE